MSTAHRTNRALSKRLDGFWPRRTLTALAIVIGVCVIYVLSIGPVLRLCKVKASTGWTGLPPAVRFIYTPLINTPEPLAGVLEHYAELWVDMEH